mmetsp:Transcript_53335/g.130287  ORF Transcript_53335/g.130287 Transcript_53335/m.130287 type:complete len:200 (-) Transcript_53335:1904-2503(-)
MIILAPNSAVVSRSDVEREAVSSDADTMPSTDDTPATKRERCVVGTMSPYPTPVEVMKISHIALHISTSFCFSNSRVFRIQMVASLRLHESSVAVTSKHAVISAQRYQYPRKSTQKPQNPEMYHTLSHPFNNFLKANVLPSRTLANSATVCLRGRSLSIQSAMTLQSTYTRSVLSRHSSVSPRYTTTKSRLLRGSSNVQ